MIINPKQLIVEELIAACLDAEMIISAVESGHAKPLSTGYVLDRLRTIVDRAEQIQSVLTKNG